MAKGSMDQRGFTLLEVMVAISIFALIGLGANQVLRTVIDHGEVLEQRTDQFAELQRALALLDRDLNQVAFRKIRDEYGEPLYPLMVATGIFPLELSRRGWRNPLGYPRSELQRVAYDLVDGQLLRRYWLVMDRAEDSEPFTQVLLDGVQDLRVEVIDENGDAASTWPDALEDTDAKVASHLMVYLALEDLGEITRTVPLVAPPVALGSGSGFDGPGGPDDRTQPRGDSIPEGGPKDDPGLAPTTERQRGR